MKSYTLTDEAEDGLAQILLYVEHQFDFATALQVLQKIEIACEKLALNPGLGHSRPDITSKESIRFWPVGPSLIAYRKSGSTIEVLFIERGSRNWAEMFD